VKDKNKKIKKKLYTLRRHLSKRSSSRQRCRWSNLGPKSTANQRPIIFNVRPLQGEFNRRRPITEDLCADLFQDVNKFVVVNNFVMSKALLMTSSTINRSKLSRSLSTGSPFNIGGRYYPVDPHSKIHDKYILPFTNYHYKESYSIKLKRISN